jgi:hypothetical protein
VSVPDEDYSRLSNLSAVSVPDEDYSRLSNLSAVNVPDEDYSRLFRKLKTKWAIETHFPEFKWIFYDFNNNRNNTQKTISICVK